MNGIILRKSGFHLLNCRNPRSFRIKHIIIRKTSKTNLASNFVLKTYNHRETKEAQNQEISTKKIYIHENTKIKTYKNLMKAPKMKILLQCLEKRDMNEMMKLKKKNNIKNNH